MDIILYSTCLLHVVDTLPLKFGHIRFYTLYYMLIHINTYDITKHKQPETTVAGNKCKLNLNYTHCKFEIKNYACLNII